MEEIKGDEPAERSGAGSIGCVSRQSRRRIEDGWTNSYLMPTGVGIVLARPAHICIDDFNHCSEDMSRWCQDATY